MVLTRASSPFLDSILGQRFPLLNGEGFVTVIDYMGNDSSVVQAARVSYGAGTKQVSEDRGLIRYLMRHQHTTPFEMATIKLLIRAPMDLWRQWIRHRTASVNEYSTRYSEAISEKATTQADKWRTQSQTNKQGSESYITAWPKGGEWQREIDLYNTPGDYLSSTELAFHHQAQHLYEMRLKLGVAREQARKDLPLSTFTEAYWSVNLHNLLHFLGLRMDGHAQQEIREYATFIGENIIAKWVPETWQAFQDYHILRGALKLTRLEKDLITMMNGSQVDEFTEAMASWGWLDYGNKLYDCPNVMHSDATSCNTCNDTGKVVKLKHNRERSECGSKLVALGFCPPWAPCKPAPAKKESDD